jgi:hypothetical protein
MMFRRWGTGALTALLGFALIAMNGETHAARSVASNKQVRKTIRPVGNVMAKIRAVPGVETVRRVVVPMAAVPAFRPAKPPAQRHYAVDGSTFYADGVRVRAAGLEALEMSSTSGIGKQKLQQLLDSGRVSIEPIGTEGGDVTVARVRIDGRDLSELAGMR